MKKYNNPKTLKGQDQINRISDLMGRMTTLNESTSLSEIDFIKKGPNGIIYGIVRENRNYFIKTTEKTSGTLMSEDFNYSGGIQNKYDERYHSYAEALKHLNMKFDMLNESYGIEEGTNLFESDGIEVKVANSSGVVVKETEEEEVNEKTVIKVDAPAPPPVEEPIEDEVEVDEFSMEDEGEDPFADEEGGEDMGDEEGMEEDGDETTKKIQKYTGKIGQLLRDKDEPDAELDKYVINSIISAINWEDIPVEDVEDIISKIEGEDDEDGEGDEFATDDEEVVDLDAEEGDVEDPFADDGGEELAESEVEYEDDNWMVLDKKDKKPKKKKSKKDKKPKKKKSKKDESRVFSKKQLMESLLKNATKKSLKRVLKENHRICEECLGEGCESCGVEEHHNMSYKKYGKFDREEYMLEDDFLKRDGDFSEIDVPERPPQRKGPNFHHIVKPDLNSDKYLKPRGMRRDGDLMSEKLKGKQHKLDRNKNGRIDAEDFKMMRKGKKQYMDEDMDIMDAIATGQDYLSATRDLDRDGDQIPNRLDMDADGDGRLDFEMGSDNGYIEMDYDSIMGTEAPVKKPGIKEPTTRPGTGTDWDKIKRPQVSPKPKAGREIPKRSFRRKGMFR